MEELIGLVLQGRYRIESLLGRQTGRRTFLAIDTQTHDPVVIKILLFGPDFTWDDLKLFEREAEVLKSLGHPAIPQYLDSFEVELARGQGFALVQSHIAAQSLQQWIQAGRTFSENDLKSIATDLLKILEYLHARQPAVIHRDIKPSNVLLADRTAHSPGQVYLVDFGSVQTAIKSGTRTIVGTYGYMPPEQFGGYTSAASDIYAVGVTIIYLATGCQPDELPQQDLQLSFEDRVKISPNLVCWLQGATNPRLEKRWQSAPQALANLVNIPLPERYSNIPIQLSEQKIPRLSIKELFIPLYYFSFKYLTKITGALVISFGYFAVCYYIFDLSIKTALTYPMYALIVCGAFYLLYVMGFITVLLGEYLGLGFNNLLDKKDKK